MPLASNPITVLLEAIFAMINIAISIVLGYVGTIGMFAMAGIVVVLAIAGLFSLLRTARR